MIGSSNHGLPVSFYAMKQLLIALVALLTLGCVDLNVPDGLLPEVELPAILSSPTPRPAPTPVGNSLQFNIPSPRFNPLLEPGQSVPGTRLEFVGKQDTFFLVQIDGFAAQKQAGDSFSWRGIIAPGVIGAYSLNLTQTFRDTQLSANGSVVLDVLEPTPVERPLPADVSRANVLRNIDINDVIPLGQGVPGTSLVWEQEANGFVEFSGTMGLPRYAIGDTLRWTGSLRPNVYIVYDVQIIGVEQYGLRLIGSAELYVFESVP